MNVLEKQVVKFWSGIKVVTVPVNYHIDKIEEIHYWGMRLQRQLPSQKHTYLFPMQSQEAEAAVATPPKHTYSDIDMDKERNRRLKHPI